MIVKKFNKFFEEYISTLDRDIDVKDLGKAYAIKDIMMECPSYGEIKEYINSLYILLIILRHLGICLIFIPDFCQIKHIWVNPNFFQHMVSSFFAYSFPAFIVFTKFKPF